MYRMGKVLRVTGLAGLLLFTFGTFCGAEELRGKLKFLAEEAQVLTMLVDKGGIQLVVWDRGTVFRNVARAADLQVDEPVAIEITRQGDLVRAIKIEKLLPFTPPGVKVITLDMLAKELDSGAPLPFMLIDVRSKESFDQAHLPQALSIPLSRFEKRPRGLLPEEMGTPLVFYDEGAGGTAATRVLELCRQAGYNGGTLYPEGISGWVKSGRFLFTTSSYIRKFKPIVIDLRPPGLVRTGHVGGAVNFPFAMLAELYGSFPSDRRAPIVLYGETDGEALAAGRLVSQWGYRNVTIYPGGASAWQESAEVLQPGPGEEAIVSSSAGKGGLLTVTDFEMALASGVSVDVVDVRNRKAQLTGSFPTARLIPLPELPARYGELDRTMIMVIFAEDENRAEMAYDFLKGLGYRVTYLKGTVTFGKDGTYTIR